MMLCFSRPHGNLTMGPLAYRTTLLSRDSRRPGMLRLAQIVEACRTCRSFSTILVYTSLLCEPLLSGIHVGIAALPWLVSHSTITTFLWHM